MTKLQTVKAAAPKTTVSTQPVQTVTSLATDGDVEDGVEDHPAIDADPRASATSEQNQIDFNDPTLDGRAAVAQNLAAQAG